MNNFLIQKKLQHILRYVSLNRVIDLGFTSIAITENNDSAFENYGLINKILNKSELEIAESKFKSLKRNPTFNFEEKEGLKENITFLEENGYFKKWHDSWMFYENEIKDVFFDSIIEVSNEKELEIFIDVFDRSYQKDDPQNPYGDAKDYLESTRKAWMKFGNSQNMKYFIVYDGNEPVAVSELSSDGGLGYISAVGSLKKVRGKGFGKKATLHAVSQSKKLGNSMHLLITEKGFYPYEFYKRIGFIPKFSTFGFTKK